MDKFTVHIIWIGGDVPSKVLHNVEKWRDTTNGNVKLWTDKDLPQFNVTNQFTESQHPAQKADLLRLEILWKYGGWYVDSDCIPGFSCFPDLGDKATFVTQDPYIITTGLIYSPKGHPFIRYFLETAVENIRNAPDGNIARVSGPYLLSSSLYSYLQEKGLSKFQEQITILPQSNFVHFPSSVRPFFENKFRKKAIALHYARNSWNSQTNEKNLSILKSLLYVIRNFDKSRTTECMRNLILVFTSARLNPYNLYFMLRLLDQDIASMQSSINTENSMPQVHSISDLKLVQQNQYVKLIQVDSQEVANIAIECGWRRLKLHRRVYKRMKLSQIFHLNYEGAN